MSVSQSVVVLPAVTVLATKVDTVTVIALSRWERGFVISRPLT